MRQVWITRIGGPKVLQLRRAPDPAPQPGQVRIRVRAAGVNFADVLARVGLYPEGPRLPAVLGFEVAGEIDELGPEVTGFKRGEPVVALTHFGGYSDVICVPRAQVHRVPSRLSVTDAAAVPVSYSLAWLMLVHLSTLHRGDWVLVHAAAGAVGLAAVQICFSRGARVIGTASAAKHERLRQMGVRHCIDYRQQDFEREVMRLTGGRGVSIALDGVGGDSFAKSYRCLGPLGRLYLYGVAGLVPGPKRSLWRTAKSWLMQPAFVPRMLMQDNRGVHGINFGELWSRIELLNEILDEVLSLVEAGTLSPVYDASFPLEQAAEAHAYLQSRQSFGKVLLIP